MDKTIDLAAAVVRLADEVERLRAARDRLRDIAALAAHDLSTGVPAHAVAASLRRLTDPSRDPKEGA